MPVIDRKTLVKKNKEGNGIRKNDVGNNRANNAALLKLADIFKKLSTNVDDEGLSLNSEVYSDELKTLATNPVNKDTAGRIDLALKNIDGMKGALESKDRYSGTTCYESAVEALGKIGSSKEEFDNLLRTVNDVFELGLEKQILKPVDPAEIERRRQEEERQRQEQERRRQERAKQIEEQQRELKERMAVEDARIRAENEEKLGVVGAFKAESSTQFATALLAEKNGQKSFAKPGEFLQNLKTEAQQRLDKMNMYPEVMTNAGERRIVVSVIKNVEELQESLKNGPAENASADEKRKFIEETAVQTSILNNSYREYNKMLETDNKGTIDWPKWADVAIDAKSTLNSLYDEKDPAFATKFKADLEVADKKKADELKEMLYPLDYPKAKEAKFDVVEIKGKPNATIKELYENLYGMDASMSEDEKDEVDSVQMAVDEKGNVYTKREDIISELSRNNRCLYVFQQDGMPPKALENSNGTLFVSKEGITAQNQIPTREGLYEPKKSLNVKDIANIPSHKEYEKMYEYGKDAKYKLKYAQDMIDRGETDKRVAQNWLDEHKKPPRLGAGRTFLRWMYKAVTVGFGETNAYKKYRVRKDRWIKNVEDNTRKVRLMDERIAAEKAILAPGSDIRKTIKAIDEKKAELDRAYYSKEPKAQKENIEAYRKRTEVRMEGVADIIKNGKVTQDNIFANTWLLEQQCKGKKIDDPGVYDNLVKYIASRTIEEKILDETIKDPEYASARNGLLVESLNNGQAFESLNKSGLYKKVIQDYTDEAKDEHGLNRPIDPEKIYKEYKNRVEQKEMQRRDPLEKLKINRQKFIEEFGERPITKDCLSDIAKLNALDKLIKSGEETYKALAELDAKEAKLAETGGQLSPDEEAERKQYLYKKNKFKDDAKEAISDLGLKVTPRTHTRQLEIALFTKPEYAQALEQVHDNLQNAAVNIEQTGAFDDLTNDQKRIINGNVDMFKLEGRETDVDLLHGTEVQRVEKYEPLNKKYGTEKERLATGKQVNRTEGGHLDLEVKQTFTLDKMTEMVNTVVEQNRQAELQKQASAEGPQIQSS